MLAEFAALPLAELTAELERMQSTFTPAAAVTPRGAAKDSSPMDRVAAGTFPTVTRSGQATPLPADPAVRGDLLRTIE